LRFNPTATLLTHKTKTLNHHHHNHTATNNQPQTKPKQDVLDWFEAKGLTAYSISAGQSLIYNNVFPKHKERLGKKVCV
jgi:hypothetical protein